MRMPSSGVESWTVVGLAGSAVEVIDEFLGWLTGIERSPNTVEAVGAGMGWRGIWWSRRAAAAAHSSRFCMASLVRCRGVGRCGCPSVSGCRGR